MTINKQALLGADKHANQHRLSRLIVEANSAELRAIAEAVEQYTDELIAALEHSEVQLLNERNSTEAALAEAKLLGAGDLIKHFNNLLSLHGKRIVGFDDESTLTVREVRDALLLANQMLLSSAPEPETTHG
ncbi:hypothetical protein JE599_004218 [Salmonella enterica]|nr:hypothetical protein [Salmonella enterica]